jgi:hypothetical protein
MRESCYDPTARDGGRHVQMLILVFIFKKMFNMWINYMCIYLGMEEILVVGSSQTLRP